MTILFINFYTYLQLKVSVLELILNVDIAASRSIVTRPAVD